jgi:hypothetical protein
MSCLNQMSVKFYDVNYANTAITSLLAMPKFEI